MNYYELLGVSKDADMATIKSAFRKKAKKYHPDVNQGNAEAERIFKELNEAYAVLSDEGKRARYNLDLENPSGMGNMGGMGQAAQRANAQNNQRARKQATGNPFMGFNMKFDFDEMMGAGMNYDKEAGKKKTASSQSQPDFMNVNAQFSKFFGFRP